MRRVLIGVLLAAAGLAVFTQCGSSGDNADCRADKMDCPPFPDGAIDSKGDRQAGGSSGAGDASKDGPDSEASASIGGSGGIAWDGAADTGADGFIAWINDPSAWTDVALPDGATRPCALRSAVPAKVLALSTVWQSCGTGCADLALGEPLHPTRRVDAVSLGIASDGAVLTPLGQINDTDYEPGGVPATFEVVRWFNLATLQTLGALYAGDLKEGVCTPLTHPFQDPRVLFTSVWEDSVEKLIALRFSPTSAGLSLTPTFKTGLVWGFIANRDALFAPVPEFSALFFDGKTVIPVDPDALVVFGSGRDELALWRYDDVVRGWVNDGQGKRPWLTGLQGQTGPLSLAPDRIVGTSRIAGANGEVIGTRIWHTTSRAQGTAVTTGPIVVPFHVSGIYAVGDWAVFDGVTADGTFSAFHGVIHLPDYQVWRLRTRGQNLEYNTGTFAIDGTHVYLGEREKKDEPRAARMLVRYELALISQVGEPVPQVAP